MLIYVPDGNETDHCHYHSEFTKDAPVSCGLVAFTWEKLEISILDMSLNTILILKLHIQGTNEFNPVFIQLTFL